MNTATNLIDIVTNLQLEGKEPKVTILPSAIKKSRKMMLRGNHTAA